MKVKELIKQLESVDPNLRVVIWNGSTAHGGHFDVDFTHLNDEEFQLCVTDSSKILFYIT